MIVDEEWTMVEGKPSYEKPSDRQNAFRGWPASPLSGPVCSEEEWYQRNGARLQNLPRGNWFYTGEGKPLVEERTAFVLNPGHNFLQTGASRKKSVPYPKGYKDWSKIDKLNYQAKKKNKN